jgi:uncharacterized protein Yka (UPF0111/DUF47 family)
MNKPNKSKAIREYIKANPTARNLEIAVACEATAQQVSQVKHNMKKSAEKPVRAYRKTTVAKKVEPKIVKVKRDKEVPLLSNKEVSKLIEQIVDFENMNDLMKKKIGNLEHNIIGYKAVIDFLEYQLKLNRNNHGATV